MTKAFSETLGFSILWILTVPAFYLWKLLDFLYERYNLGINKTNKKRKMKKIINLLLALFTISLVTSCAEVEDGYVGVGYYPYSGGVDTERVFQEGEYVGIGWLWNEMITYNKRQQTTNMSATMLDKDNMEVTIQASLFHRVIPEKIGELHLEKGRDYEETYVKVMFDGAVMNVLGKYTAQELVSSKRAVVQKQIKEIMTEALAANHILCDNVIIRDIDLPDPIQKAIIAKQVQDQKNLLAEKKVLEEENLAEAKVAKAQGNFDAGLLDAKTKKMLSQPEMIRLIEAENRRLMWEGYNKHGTSPLGNHNMFGTTPMVLKNL